MYCHNRVTKTHCPTDRNEIEIPLPPFRPESTSTPSICLVKLQLSNEINYAIIESSAAQRIWLQNKRTDIAEGRRSDESCVVVNIR